MKKQEILDLVNETQTPQIRAGEVHRFNDIWLVVAEDRIFCRQYSFGTRSWYSAFQDDPNGAIKCGESIILVKVVILSDLNEVNSKVNEAYIEKYDKRLKHYPDIAHQMTGEKYVKTTMELTPQLV